MSGNRWERVKEIFQAALDRKPEEWAAYLEQTCGDDPALRSEVDSMLRAHVSAATASFAGQPAINALAVAHVAPPPSVAIRQRLGHYQIEAVLGAGGMGIVYRARDTRPKLDRIVAIKVLTPDLRDDLQLLQRFEREGRALAALNHPHICAVFDVGQADGIDFLVMEYVAGETLAERLNRSDALPVREALAIAIDVADALDAAHAHGIVHRDLKPANIKITPDGVVKVLDFGLAKLPGREASGSDASGVHQTREGTTVGTAAYMSPEQTRGQTVDKRTDIWAFGCVLFEMLTGTIAFHGATIADTMVAIIERDPDSSVLPASTPQGVRRLLTRCLEKDARRRLHDAADARIEIDDALSTASTAGNGGRARVAKFVPWIAALGLAAAGALVALFATRWRASDPPPTFHQITFRRGSIYNARFAPDGQTVVYSAFWDGPPGRTFATRVSSPDTSPMPFEHSTVLAISKSGRMAIRLSAHPYEPGTLAEVSLTGQAPRELLTNVGEADWAPSGDELAVTHLVGKQLRLEYPIGTVLYSSGGQIVYPRFSPDGQRIAFIEGQGGGIGTGTENSFRVVVVDRSGHVTVASEGWSEAFALAWAPSGKEIWISARALDSPSGGLELHAVSLSGRRRLVARLPGILFLRDVWSDGRVLVDIMNWPVTMMCETAGAPNERSFSWLDFSKAQDISNDGSSVLFDEGGLAEGSKSGVYLRRFDSAAAIRLGSGRALSFSPDGASVLALEASRPDQLQILPTGPGEKRTLRAEGFNYLEAAWFPDGKRLLVAGLRRGYERSLFVQNVVDGALRRVVDNAAHGVLSPDGRTIATIAPTGAVTLTPVDGGAPRVISGVSAGASLLRWDATGRYLFVKTDADMAVNVSRFDLETRRAELWRTLKPTDLAGIAPDQVTYSIALSADGRTYCYSFVRYLSSLFVVDGLK